MDKEQPKVKNPLGMLVMTAIVIILVGYMYSDTLQAYWAGGDSAPSLTTVVVGGVVLGAGALYMVICAIRIFLQAKKEEKEKKDEEQEKPEA